MLSIIQLFGRGVRLHGLDNSLKRSSKLQQIDTHDYQYIVETLNIFGLKSNYMSTFQNVLEKEGCPVNDKIFPIDIPIKRTESEISQMKVMRLKKGVVYKNAVRYLSLDRDAYFKDNPIIVDYYKKTELIKSDELTDSAQISIKEEDFFNDIHINLMDWGRIFKELVEYKNLKKMWNIIITQNAIQDILGKNSDCLYKILIPKNDLNVFRTNDFQKQITFIEDISITILKKYLYKYYYRYKETYEADKREYVTLDNYEKDFIGEDGASHAREGISYGNIPHCYSIQVTNPTDEIMIYFEKLKSSLEKDFTALKEFDEWAVTIKPYIFKQHGYIPLLYMNKNDKIVITPTHLNDGEYQFVNDLKDYYNDNKDFFKDKKFYFIRNLARGHGLGFVEANNFYPDFILWLEFNKKQYMTFIDPKGLIMVSQDNEKIKFYNTIKTIQSKMNDKDVILNSFILSDTPFDKLKSIWNNPVKDDLEKKNILFLDDKEYLNKMFSKILI